MKSDKNCDDPDHDNDDNHGHNDDDDEKNEERRHPLVRSNISYILKYFATIMMMMRGS